MINFVLWSGTKLGKRHKLLIASSKDLKCFDDLELVFPLDKFLGCSIFNMFKINKRKKNRHGARVCFNFL